MSHDVHFLERLERVDVGQAERALGLYRNPELVKALLGELELPPGADRVAIALDSEEPSPHVIVTRDGHFVTCLAAEMSLGTAFRVRRAQLDGVRARHERFRAAHDAAASGQLKRALQRLMEAPAIFCREDAQLIGAVQPLLGARFGAVAADCYKAHLRLINRLRARASPEQRRADLKTLWRIQWIMSALMAATTAQGVLPELAASERDLRSVVSGWTTQVAFGLLLRATAARGLWALARVARYALPELKRIRAEALSVVHIAVVNLTLGLVALRHPKYRAEITKVLQTVPGQGEADAKVRDTIAGVDSLTREPLLKMLADPERAQANAEARLLQWRERGAPDETEEDPGLIYFVTYAAADREIALWPYEVLTALPWLARANFDDLFGPRAVVDFAPPNTSDLEFLAELGAKVAVPEQEPVRAQAQVGRNEPCPCGSGKKAKKCCAA